MDCLNCDIEQKLQYCCMNHPVTGEMRLIEIEGRMVEACPNLNERGICADYENRPEPCRKYDCMHGWVELIGCK